MAASATVETVASVVQTIGVIAAGLWAAWTFQKLQRQRAAEVDIQKGLAETQQALAESEQALAETRRAVAEREKTAVETVESERRLLSQQPNLEISFTRITEHRAADPTAAWLSVGVDLQNAGSRNLEIYFDDAAVRAGRFSLQDRHLRQLSEVYRVAAGSIAADRKALDVMPSRILRAGQRRSMAFLLPAPEPGLYLVEFQAVYCMYPFEAEKPSSKAQPLLIQAVEQVVVPVGLADGKELLDQPVPSAGSVPV